MSVPIIRRFTRAAGVLLVPAFFLDNESGLTFIRITGNNVILDVVNDPDPAAGDFYTIILQKNYIDTGRRIYTNSISPLSAGRMAIGPIGLSAGDYSFLGIQTVGVAAAHNICVKLVKTP